MPSFHTIADGTPVLAHAGGTPSFSRFYQAHVCVYFRDDRHQLPSSPGSMPLSYHTPAIVTSVLRRAGEAPSSLSGAQVPGCFRSWSSAGRVMRLYRPAAEATSVLGHTVGVSFFCLFNFGDWLHAPTPLL